MSHQLGIIAKKDDQVTRDWARAIVAGMENPTCDNCGQPIEDMNNDGVLGIKVKTSSFMLYHVHCAPAKLKRIAMFARRRRTATSSA